MGHILREFWLAGIECLWEWLQGRIQAGIPSIRGIIDVFGVRLGPCLILVVVDEELKTQKSASNLPGQGTIVAGRILTSIVVLGRP